MKKIIATVLAMVMALALCTVAFADTTKVDAVEATSQQMGHDTYWLKDGKYYADKDCEKVYNDAISDMLAAGGYYKISLVKYAAAVDATCTEAGYAVDIWNDANGNYYVKKSDVDAANKKGAGLQTDDGSGNNLTVTYIGTSMSDFDGYYTIAVNNHVENAKNYGKTAATHVLYETSETFGANKTTVYACALCGAKFVTKAIAGSTDGATAAEVAKLDKVDYSVDTAKRNYVNYVLNNKGILTNKAFVPTATETMYKISASTTTPSTDTNKSPKTFDAGIAMYVGMALTSVAGSAVVIGKKKEF